MKLSWLIFLLTCVSGCEVVTATTTSDGRKGFVVDADGSDSQCLGLAGQHCEYGFDVVKADNNQYHSHCTIIVACHDKFVK